MDVMVGVLWYGCYGMGVMVCVYLCVACAGLADTKLDWSESRCSCRVSPIPQFLMAFSNALSACCQKFKSMY